MKRWVFSNFCAMLIVNAVIGLYLILFDSDTRTTWIDGTVRITVIYRNLSI